MHGIAAAIADQEWTMPHPSAAARFEIDRQRHVRALVERLPGEVDVATWPLERLHARRDARLRALVRIARERSPWYARRLAHVDPDTLTGDDLSAIPPMTKADLMAHWDEIVTDRRLTLDLASAHLARVAAEGPAYLLEDYQVVASGGSTGVRGVFVWDFRGLLLSWASLARHHQWRVRYADLAPVRRGAQVMAAHGTHLSTVLGETFAGPAGASCALPVTLPLAEIVAGLNECQPEAISAYPSALHRLALEAQAGRLQIRPRVLSTAAEPLLPEARTVINETFHVPVGDLYGCSEAGMVAISYPGATPLHLIEDIAVYEPVDRAGRPVPPGTPAATMLITNVVNQVLPLIRYEITDEVMFLAEPNPDPWTGRRIAPVPGRLDDAFVYDAGVEVHPHVFRSALSEVPAICEYQVRQTPRGAAIFVCAAQTEALEPVRRQLAGALTRLGLVAPDVSIEAVDHLDRISSTGKLKRFVPLPARGPDRN